MKRKIIKTAWEKSTGTLVADDEMFWIEVGICVSSIHSIYIHDGQGQVWSEKT